MAKLSSFGSNERTHICEASQLKIYATSTKLETYSLIQGVKVAKWVSQPDHSLTPVSHTPVCATSMTFPWIFGELYKLTIIIVITSSHRTDPSCTLSPCLKRKLG